MSPLTIRLPSHLFLFVLIAVLHSARGTTGGWDRANKHKLLNNVHNLHSSPSLTLSPATKDLLMQLRGGQSEETSDGYDEGSQSTFTFPPSWLTHTTTGAMCTGFMCYNGLSLVLFPQKVMASYGIQPTVKSEENGDDNEEENSGIGFFNRKQDEVEVEEDKEFNTDITLENKLLRMIGSIEFGLGLLVYLTALPKRDIFADWTLQQVIALSIAPRFLVSTCSYLFPMIASLFSRNSDDTEDVDVDTATTPLEKQKIALLSMNAPFLLFVIISLIINPSSDGWSAYPSIVAKVFSVLMVLEALQFLIRPLHASDMYFQLNIDDNDKKHAKALTRAFANDLLTSSFYMTCVAWDLFGNNGPKIAGYVSLLYIGLLFDMGYISKTWKLMDANGPWAQNVHIFISLFFATGFLLS